MTKLRGGVFGCGMISEFHLRGWLRIPEVEIVALGNRTLARAEERRVQFCPTARTYERLEQLLERERLDFLDILTIPSLHRSHCMMAHEAGLHVICQKPLSDSLEDGVALVRAMEGSPKLFAVHENHRYRPWFQHLRKLHDEKVFGTIRVLRLEQYDPSAPAERYKRESPRGLFLEYGTHLVDMIRALLGEPIRVYARMHDVSADMKGESHAVVVYEFPEATAVINIAARPGPAFGSVALEGEHGAAYFQGTMTRGHEARFTVMRGSKTLVDETRSPYADYVESFYLLERECVDCMISGKTITQRGTENLNTFATTLAAYESMTSNSVVEIRPSPV